MCGVEEILGSKMLFVSENYINAFLIEYEQCDEVKKLLKSYYEADSEVTIVSDVWDDKKKLHTITLKPFHDDSTRHEIRMTSHGLEWAFIPATEIKPEFCKAVSDTLNNIDRIRYEPKKPHANLKYALNQFVRGILLPNEPNEDTFSTNTRKFIKRLESKSVLSIPLAIMGSDKHSNGFNLSWNETQGLGKFIYKYIIENKVELPKQK